MRSLLLFLIAIPVYSFAGLSPQHNQKFPDYSSYTHQINLDQFRGGLHDEKTQYFFKMKILAYEQTTAEKKHTVEVEIPIEWTVSQARLEYWKPLPADKKLFIHKVEGEAIRNLVAQLKTEKSIEEQKIIVKGEVSVYWQKPKYFGIFGSEDVVVATLEYFVILEDKSKLLDQNLEHKAQKDGLVVAINVNFKK